MNLRDVGLLVAVVATVGVGAAFLTMRSGEDGFPEEVRESSPPSRTDRAAGSGRRAAALRGDSAKSGGRSSPLREGLRPEVEARRREAPDASAAVVQGLREAARSSASVPDAAPVADGEDAEARAGGAALARGRNVSTPFDKAARSEEGGSPVIEQNVKFDPEQPEAHFPPGAALAYPEAGGVDSEQGTIAFWMRREWDPADSLSRPLVQLRTATWENRLELGVGSTYVGFNITTADGFENGAGSQIRWGADEWHHVTATWDDSLMSFYVDGQLVDQRSYSGDLHLPSSAPLYVGSTPSGPSLADGPISMRGFTVTQSAATPEGVRELLAQSPPEK